LVSDISLAETEKNKPILILKGDSHSLHVRSAILQAIQDSLFGDIKYWGMSGCHSIKNASHSTASGRDPKFCNQMNIEFFDQVSSGGNNILIVDRTNLGLYGFNGKMENNNGPWISFSGTQLSGEEFEAKFHQEYLINLCALAEKNNLWVMRPIPEVIVNPPIEVARNILFGRGDEDIKITLKAYHERNKLVWEAQDEAAEKCGVKILNPLPYLCDEQYCYGSKNGRPLYFDDDHLSEYGNKFLVPMFEEVFKSHSKN
jgi:hypothetical protein